MDILYLISSLICAMTWCIGKNEYGFKLYAYIVIIELFFMLVLAYLILSIAKFKIEKIKYLKERTIVGWDIEYESSKKEHKLLPYVISCICGLILGTALLFADFAYYKVVLLALALAFNILGWWIMAIKRVKSAKQSVPDFLLSHIGMIYGDRVSVFNGYSHGITRASVKDGKLLLTVLKKNIETEYAIAIPEDKKKNVDDFIIDLKEYFKNEK